MGENGLVRHAYVFGGVEGGEAVAQIAYLNSKF